MVVEPASVSEGMRIDLFVPTKDVKQVQHHFLRQIKRDGHQLVWTDYEGFEAEVYFEFERDRSEKRGKAGLMRALVSCKNGTLVSFEVFE